MKKIAIIGGGYSGTMVLANLVALANAPLKINLFEPSENLAEGAAYSTTDNCHLLNVRANRMGAFAGDPNGVFAWLQSDEGKREAARLWPNQGISADMFVPRMVYGAYLKHILQTALNDAPKKNITIHIHREMVNDVAAHQNTFSVSTAEKSCDADAVVLATGHHAPRSFLPTNTPHYFDNPWQALRSANFRNQITTLGAKDNIVIIGTGLTMVDAVLSLHKYGYKGNITAISRNGWLPTPHAAAKQYPAWEWVNAPAQMPDSALAALVGLRAEIAKAEAAGHNWRDVIDSIRPVSQALWQRFNVAEKRKFMKRLGTLWNIHRHRMAPEIHDTIQQLQQTGQLKVIAARLGEIESNTNGLVVNYRTQKAKVAQTIHATMLLNCTGPQYDITAIHNPLIQKLRERGMIVPSPLGSGIDISHIYPNLFPIGALTTGEIFESTAIPELRDTANLIAEQILALN